MSPSLEYLTDPCKEEKNVQRLMYSERVCLYKESSIK